MMSVQHIIICLKYTSRKQHHFPQKSISQTTRNAITILYVYVYYMYTCIICIHVLYVYYLHTCTICIHDLCYMHTCTILCMHVLYYVYLYYIYTCTICIYILYAYMYTVCKVLLCNPPNWSCVVLQHMICLGTMT